MLALVSVAPALHAQPAPSAEAPFSHVALWASVSNDVGRTRFDTFYRGGPGVDIGAQTPFYRGVAGFDVSLRHYEARPGQASEDFWALPAALRWNASLPVWAPRLHVEGGPRLGALLMRFSGGSAGLRNESELLLGADAVLSFRLSERWALTTGLRYEHVYFSTGVDLWRAHAGLRWRLAAPSWLQTFLR